MIEPDHPTLPMLLRAYAEWTTFHNHIAYICLAAALEDQDNE